jgi:hypothetical protein
MSSEAYTKARPALKIALEAIVYMAAIVALFVLSAVPR